MNYFKLINGNELKCKLTEIVKNTRWNENEITEYVNTFDLLYIYVDDNLAYIIKK